MNREKVPSFADYPFCLPALRHLRALPFHPRVTFIIGENGSGKSTLLEAIAVAYGLNAEGGSKNFDFASQATHSPLYDYLRLVKGAKKPRDSFFLRAESFYNVATQIDRLDAEHSFGPPLKLAYGGRSLHQQSHGEAFLALFLNRFGGHGLYLLDEPEAALSPARQMTLLSRMHQLVRQDSQLIIATHSPILMAYPDALIYQIKDDLEAVPYQDTEHYQVMRSFITNPQKMLDILLNG